MRLKLARTLACVSARNASSVAKSGTSAARASSPMRPGAAATRVERTRQAEPQDLCEIMIEPHRRAQDLGVLGGEHASRQAFSSTRAVEVSRISGVAAACTSCRYWAMNSMSISPPATYLRFQRSLSPFSRRDRRAHFDDVAGGHLRVARAAQHGRGSALRRARRIPAKPTRRARA